MLLVLIILALRGQTPRLTPAGTDHPFSLRHRRSFWLRIRLLVMGFQALRWRHVELLPGHDETNRPSHRGPGSRRRGECRDAAARTALQGAEGSIVAVTIRCRLSIVFPEFDGAPTLSRPSVGRTQKTPGNVQRACSRHEPVSSLMGRSSSSESASVTVEDRADGSAPPPATSRIGDSAPPAKHRRCRRSVDDGGGSRGPSAKGANRMAARIADLRGNANAVRKPREVEERLSQCGQQEIRCASRMTADSQPRANGRETIGDADPHQRCGRIDTASSRCAARRV